MSLVLRPRSMWEGSDLGVRLLQSQPRSVFPSFLLIAVPLFVLFYATVDIAWWLPVLLMWISKPWLDRTILFALSRALFGEPTTPADVWAARGAVWGAQLVTTVTLRRLSASRAFTQPVRQLEGLSGAARSARVRQLTVRHRGVARMATFAFLAAEFGLFVSFFSLQAYLAPSTGVVQWTELFRHPPGQQIFMMTFSYAAAIWFLEPFYVAAGFGMYLNRRVELEAWDIEQEFRRAFAP